jgi:DNA-binding beta-propeller fold protein YncE
VENLSETVSVVNLDRWQAGITPHSVSPLFLSGRVPNSIATYAGKGYIVNSTGNSVTVFSLRDTEARHELALFPNANPWAIAFVQRGSVLYALVTCWLDNSLAIVRVEEGGGSLVGRIPLRNGMSPEGIVIVGDTAWIAMSGFNFSTYGYDAGYVTIVDISSDDPDDWQEIDALPVADDPQALVFDEANDKVYVLSTGAIINWPVYADGELAVFDAVTHAKKRDAVIPGGAQAIVLDETSGHLFIAGGGFIACYDSASLARVPQNAFSPLPAASDPSALALDPDRKFLFAADFANNRVLAFDLDTDQLAEIIPCGDGPVSLVCVTVE